MEGRTRGNGDRRKEKKHDYYQELNAALAQHRRQQSPVHRQTILQAVAGGVSRSDVAALCEFRPRCSRNWYPNPEQLLPLVSACFI